MKSEKFSIIKDIIISILIVVTILLIISIIFYNKISLSKVIPEAEEYVLSNEMQEDLDEGKEEEAKQIVTTYYIDAADLKNYEKNKEYNKGKKNPFAEVSTSSSNSSTSGNNNSNKNNSSTENNEKTNENFYEDDGTK